MALDDRAEDESSHDADDAIGISLLPESRECKARREEGESGPRDKSSKSPLASEISASRDVDDARGPECARTIGISRLPGSRECTARRKEGEGGPRDGSSKSQLASEISASLDVDDARDRECASMPAGTTNDADGPIPKASATRVGRGTPNRGRAKIPPVVVASTNDIDASTTASAASPAVGFPPGWTMRRMPRIGTGRSDTRYYPPESNRYFRTKPDALRFAKALNEADGDEEKAMVLYRTIGKEKRRVANVARVTSDHGVDDKHGGRGGAETETATSQPKRRRRVGATKKALLDLALGKEDGSTATSPRG